MSGDSFLIMIYELQVQRAKMKDVEQGFQIESATA